MSEPSFPEPSHETSVRIQGSKETARGDGSTDRAKPPWRVGDRLGDFVLEHLLGRGTSGYVYRALDRTTGLHCALKLLLPGTPEELGRTKLGFRRMVSLQHPNLLRVGRIHQLDQYIALSMEEVPGQVLPHAIRSLPHDAPDRNYRRLTQWTRDFASALATMHVHGYLHRDIKPQNLMIDAQGSGRVIDYGLVGTFDPDSDPHGLRHYLAGTPRYFAPEVLWNQHYLPAGDVFSLGMVILESMRHISRDQRIEQADIERSEDSPQEDAQRIHDAINELDSTVPDDLRGLCLEMLQRDPADRPTAMRVARVGQSKSVSIHWPKQKKLVGRQRETDRIFHWLDHIYAGGIGRLSIHGPSGIGKTCLLDEIEKFVRSMRWGQVFRANCRSREDQPFQAFDQICDAIANRYRQGDREPLLLDAVSTAMLHGTYPVLKNVVRCNMQIATSSQHTDRLDGLEAVVRMSERLRDVGPLILIVDDVHWADRDSLSVLDRLQKASGAIGLGIITAARGDQEYQLVPADQRIDLPPLEDQDAAHLLSEAAGRWGIELNDSMASKLCEIAGGNPFRLQQLADEFLPGGAFSAADALETKDLPLDEAQDVDRLLKRRAKRLSEEAQQVLLYVVAAQGRVSTKQLGTLTEMGDTVDAAVSELVQQRLISDEATGGFCIQIVHDRVADGLVKAIPETDKRMAHRRWAAMLIREDQPETWAARIAGHLFAAGEPGRAVSYAILAAEAAERLFAKSEAARWHASVIDHVSGREKVERIRHAARCYQEADHPIAAAKYYRRLAHDLDADERIECQLLAVSLEIRSGRFDQVRRHLIPLAQSLGLPYPTSTLIDKARALLEEAVCRFCAINNRLKDRLLNPGPGTPSKISMRDKQRLSLCLKLSRPMSMFDCRYAMQLNRITCRLAAKYGSADQRMQALLGRLLYGCLDRGSRRETCEQLLVSLGPEVAAIGQAGIEADWWAAKALMFGMSCRWQDTRAAAQMSVDLYRLSPPSHAMQIAHTQWLEIWANWNLGRWKEMFDVSEAMFDDALRRNDWFQRSIVSAGIGSAAWLGRDRIAELDRIHAKDQRLLGQQSLQMFGIFFKIAAIQRLLYDGQFDRAWMDWKEFRRRLAGFPFGGIQVIRLVKHSLDVLIGLHLAREKSSHFAMAPLQQAIHQLRQEELPQADMLANLYDGLSRRIIDQDRSAVPAAEHALRQAAEMAEEHGFLPWRLAAEDALAGLETGVPGARLRGEMLRQGVARPQRFERLYTVSGW